MISLNTRWAKQSQVRKFYPEESPGSIKQKASEKEENTPQSMESATENIPPPRLSWR